MFKPFGTVGNGYIWGIRGRIDRVAGRFPKDSDLADLQSFNFDFHGRGHFSLFLPNCPPGMQISLVLEASMEDKDDWKLHRNERWEVQNLSEATPLVHLYSTSWYDVVKFRRDGAITVAIDSVKRTLYRGDTPMAIRVPLEWRPPNPFNDQSDTSSNETDSTVDSQDYLEEDSGLVEDFNSEGVAVQSASVQVSHPVQQNTTDTSAKLPVLNATSSNGAVGTATVRLYLSGDSAEVESLKLHFKLSSETAKATQTNTETSDFINGTDDESESSDDFEDNSEDSAVFTPFESISEMAVMCGMFEEPEYETVYTGPVRIYPDWSVAYANFRLRTSDKYEFLVNKEILAAKSRIFAAIFDCDLKENGDGLAHLHIGSRLLVELLKFAYEGTTTDAFEDDSFVNEIYIAAVKYDLLELRDICQRFLLAQLCRFSLPFGPLCSSIRLAQLHGDTQLLAGCLQFVRDRRHDVQMPWGQLVNLGDKKLRREMFQLAADSVWLKRKRSAMD